MSYNRLPTSQARTLRSLAEETFQEKLFQPDLSRAEAAKGSTS